MVANCRPQHAVWLGACGSVFWEALTESNRHSNFAKWLGPQYQSLRHDRPTRQRYSDILVLVAKCVFYIGIRQLKSCMQRAARTTDMWKTYFGICSVVGVGRGKGVCMYRNHHWRPEIRPIPFSSLKSKLRMYMGLAYLQPMWKAPSVSKTLPNTVLETQKQYRRQYICQDTLLEERRVMSPPRRCVRLLSGACLALLEMWLFEICLRFSRLQVVTSVLIAAPTFSVVCPIVTTTT